MVYMQHYNEHRIVSKWYTKRTEHTEDRKVMKVRSLVNTYYVDTRLLASEDIFSMNLVSPLAS